MCRVALAVAMMVETREGIDIGSIGEVVERRWSNMLMGWSDNEGAAAAAAAAVCGGGGSGGGEVCSPSSTA